MVVLEDYTGFENLQTESWVKFFDRITVQIAKTFQFLNSAIGLS